MFLTVKTSAFTDMFVFRSNTYTNEKIGFYAVNAKVYFYGQSANPLLFCSVSLTSL